MEKIIRLIIFVVVSIITACFFTMVMRDFLIWVMGITDKIAYKLGMDNCDRTELRFIIIIILIIRYDELMGKNR